MHYLQGEITTFNINGLNHIIVIIFVHYLTQRSDCRMYQTTNLNEQTFADLLRRVLNSVYPIA